MKKIFICACLALALAACDDDSERHQISVVYPENNGVGNVYADQTLDSIIIWTFDSYKCTVVQGESWMTIDSEMKQQTIPNSYYNMYAVTIPVYFSTNDTDSTRLGYVSINNYGDDWNETVYTGFLQFGWLNITRPTAKYVYDSNYMPTQGVFAMADSAYALTDSIAFTVHDKWTLRTEDTFVSLADTSGNSGENVAHFSLAANNSTESRSATLTLTSNGISTPITIVQSGKSEE